MAWGRGIGKCTCPYCHELQEKITVLDCDDALLAIINTEKSGKSFSLAPENAIPSISAIDEEEKRVLNEIHTELPKSELPVWSGIVNPALYGMKTHADFLNRRQMMFFVYLKIGGS